LADLGVDSITTIRERVFKVPHRARSRQQRQEVIVIKTTHKTSSRQLSWLILITVLLLALISPLTANAIVVGDQTASSSPKKLIAEANRLINAWHGDGALLDEAARLISGVLESDPANSAALIELSRLTLKDGYIQGDRYQKEAIEESLSTIERAIEIDPDNPKAYSVLASIQLIRKEYDAAEKALTRGKQAGPWPWLDFYDAELHEKRGDDAKAEALYIKIIEEQPPEDNVIPAAIRELAYIYKEREENSKAESLLRLLIKMEPDNAWHYGNLARHLYFRNGDFREACKFANQALEIMDYGNAREVLGYSLYGLWATETEDNERYFDLALKLEPNVVKVMQGAAERKSTFPVTKALIEKGVSINVKGRDGATILVRAAGYSNETLADILALKPNLELQESNKWTPLGLSANTNAVESMKLLLDAGADINGGSYMNQPPLWFATRKNNLEAMRLLIERGANINKPDNNGAIPVMAASFSGHLEAAKLMVESGADLSATTIYRQNAADIAFERGYNEVGNYLREHEPLHTRAASMIKASPRITLGVSVVALVLLLVVRQRKKG